MEYALPLLPGNKAAVSFPGALPLLAALTPEGHSITILDENIDTIDFERLRTFDVVGVTGMIVQKRRIMEILSEVSGRGPIVCVGGPYVTVEEQYLAGLCDVVFHGEADETWPEFIDDVAYGRPIKARYAQATPTDMSKLPCPRYDLVQTGRYLTATTQFSRGCPYLCEFCDIIVIFGRKPRLKAEDQIIAELDSLLRVGVRAVFFVDDNFIGNKAKAKSLLSAIVQWQERNGYKMTFSTEATINVADDPELLQLLRRAKFASVFIGIESPRSASLIETRKLQNTRGDSLEAKVARIQSAGIIVQAGLIVGFDHDDALIFDEQFHFLQLTGIGAPFVSILSPIPTTPLYERLQREGRLTLDDELVWFEPKGMSKQQLKNGYSELNSRIYAADAFFARIFTQLSRQGARNRRPLGLFARGVALSAALGTARRLLWQATKHQKFSVGLAYLAALCRNILLGENGLSWLEFFSLCARHWHCYRVAELGRSYWGRSGEPQNSDAPSGRWRERLEIAQVS
ncbi:MAG: hypothetical protein QOD74_3108 [Variibacter sp.]|jgi:radical SAM superfamily enzyme YgiQ (UPF0313 family)|nr:hypothetical protein [Variibacter sp.]